MGQKALGTLALPWPASTQRTLKRVPVDPVLLAITLILALVGVVMVFSASAVVARIDYGIWKKLAIPLLLLTTALLVLVLVPSLGSAAKGARRWLHVGPINIQPAELTKFVVVMYLAAYVSKKQDQLTEFARGLLPPLIILASLSGLVLLEPDLGTVVVMGLVAVTLLFLAGARIKHLALLSLCALPAVAHWLLDTSLDEVYWPCSHSRAIPSFPSQLEWKIGLPWANTRGILNSPS